MSAAALGGAGEPLRPLEDPVAQWLDWEEQANLVGFRTSTHPVEVEVAVVPRAAVEIHELPGLPAEIRRRFLRRDRVCFPRHPLNRDASVAWFEAPTRERWTARFTSSRTLAMPGPESGHALFSLKLATDHPHPDFHQPEKVKLREEALGAVEWVGVLDRIDRMLGPLQCALLVREVLVVLSAGGESGYMVRDLRLFQNGCHYLPALSLPFVGPALAARQGQPFDGFWAQHYAAPVGRAKAELMARYGLWFETPNPQNVVIQLDGELRPTGRLVFRDVGDGECATDAFTSSGVPWTRLLQDLRLETQNSFWAFGEADGQSVGADTLESWYRSHDQAYWAELARWFEPLAPPPGTPPERQLEHWNQALRSEASRGELARCFAREGRDAAPQA